MIMVNLVNGSIEKDRLVYTAPETLQRNGLKTYGRGTVLFSRVGDIKVGYANRDRFTISPNIIVMDCGDEARAKYIALFFNTPYGRVQIQRQLKVAAQPTISTQIISKLKIPDFSGLVPLIAKDMSEAERLLDGADRAYSQAEAVLRKMLGVMERPQRKHEVSVKKMSESYTSTGRLDAEYYQLKYDQLFATLAAFTTNPLGGPGGIADFQKSIEPGSGSYGKEGIPFVRVSDVTKFGVSEPEIRLPTDIVEHPEALFPKKNSILFSKDGSVGIAYKLEEDAQFITSSALLRLTVRNTEKVLPDYLTLVLNSPVVQLQAERAASGAIIQHWKPSEIQQVIIPVVDMAVQQELSRMVQQSFSLRRQSEQLLNRAKQAVELAIEQGEDAAMAWLKEAEE